MADSLPPNVHVSQHPCARAKISQLRSSETSARETKTLIHEIALIVGCEALAHGLASAEDGTDTSPLGYDFAVDTVAPSRISIMPILRSGLSMLDAIQTLLPNPVPVHHLGLFREKSTMAAVEYYNNLPEHHTSSTGAVGGPSELTILIDPVIATGATATAAIETLRDWGVRKILLVSIIASRDGIARAAEEWPEGVQIWTAAMDAETDGNGMLKPGLGDVGDRLFLTMGK